MAANLLSEQWVLSNLFTFALFLRLRSRTLTRSSWAYSNLVFLPPGGGVPPSWACDQRDFFTIEEVEEGSGSSVPLAVQISTCLHAQERKEFGE